jgi:flavin reductase (DIM6/NTAB) family NADH-FMN oxidoreductase RutF
MSAGWHTALSAKPPLYGVAIAPERHSYELLRLSGRFGVNFLSFDLAEAIAGAGLLTGADGSDKFASLSLDWYETAAGLPLLSSAYLAYACTVKQQVVTGDHDFFIGDVTHVHFDPLAFDLRVKSRERQPAVIYHGRSLYEAATGGPTKLILPETIRNKNSSGGNR